MEHDDSVDSPAESARAESPNFFAMKASLLSLRTEQSAVAMLDSLLASRRGDHINLDVLFDLKDLLVCIFDTVGAVHLAEKYQIKVLDAINNSPAKVVDIVADYFNSNLQQLFTILATSNLAITIAFARRLADLDCTESIAQLISHFVHIQLVQDELSTQLNTACTQTRFRVHNVTALALKQAEHLSTITKFVNKLASELDSNDILSQLNAIEIFTDAASQNEKTANFLVSIGVVDRLYALFNQSADHPDSGFLYPAFLKFFGHLAVANISCIERYEKFSHSLFDLVCQFDRLDASLRLVAFDTFAAVCSTKQAKLLLSSRTLVGRYSFEQAMNSFGAATASGPLDLRVRHLDALALLFKCDNRDKVIDEVTHKWFTWLGEPFPMLLVAYMKKPFADLRAASLRLVLQLENYNWAVGTLCATSGFMECLLNRCIETTVEGKHLKFDVICKLIENGDGTVAPEDMAKLKLYRQRGVFFVEAIPDVDMKCD